MHHMESTALEDKITALLKEKFQEEEFQDCFLVELNLTPNRKLDEGINFDTCRRVSRHLEAHLDSEQWLGPKYTLEVSSPGVSRPLKLWRQYPKNIGRQVEVSLIHEEKTRKGKLKDVQDDWIVIEEVHTVKQGKKKTKEPVEVEIPFDQIEKTIVKVSF